MGILRIKSNNSPEGAERIVPNARRHVFVENSDGYARLFCDVDLTQMMANPIIANENGIFPDCFVQDGLYKVIAKDTRGTSVQSWVDLRVSSQLMTDLVGGFRSIADLEADTTLKYTSVPVTHSVQPGDLIQVLDADQTFCVAEAEEDAPHVSTVGGVKMHEAGRRYSLLARFQEAVARGDSFVQGDIVMAGGELFHFTGGAGEPATGLIGWDPVYAAGNGDSGPNIANVEEMLETAPGMLTDGELVRTGEEGFVFRVNTGGVADLRAHGGAGFDIVARDNLSARMFGAIGDGSSHPLSERYASLGAAQVLYPHATALTDEIDWCAWQALADHLYDRAEADHATLNLACGSVVVDGRFMVNKTITFNLAALKVEGLTPGHRFAGYSSQAAFKYNGPNGTVDAPVWIIDCWLFDEFGNPPSERNGNSVLGGGGRYEISGVTFGGKGGSMTGMVGNESGYISGVRIRKSAFSKIENCNFGDTLWDGVNLTDGQLFLKITRCFFYAVYRDGISIQRVHAGSGFSTTCWIDNNEFGYVGRYHILGDFRGSVDADPRIRDNSFELGNNNFFPSNPDWWVNGVVSPVCMLEAGNLIYDGNRCEGITDIKAKYWSDLHLVAGHDARITGGVIRNIFCSSLKNSAPENVALLSDAAARGYRDITDQRNYNCGVVGDTRSGVQGMVVSGVYILNKILIAAQPGVGTSNTGRIQLEGISAGILAVPVIAGTYASQVQARPVAPAEFKPLSNLVAINSLITDYYGTRDYIYGSPTSGQFVAKPDSSAMAAWAASATVYADAAGLNWRNARRPTVSNGFAYQAIVGGTTDATEPTWPTSTGATVVDVSVVI